MLTDADKQTIQEIFDKAIDRVEVKIDKVLKTAKIKRKLKIPTPSTSVIFA